ncbi:hypothetical protein HK096_001242, partial [Nowakowskiella sp. JEL0078]
MQAPKKEFQNLGTNAKKLRDKIRQRLLNQGVILPNSSVVSEVLESHPFKLQFKPTEPKRTEIVPQTRYVIPKNRERGNRPLKPKQKNPAKLNDNVANLLEHVPSDEFADEKFLKPEEEVKNFEFKRDCPQNETKNEISIYEDYIENTVMTPPVESDFPLVSARKILKEKFPHKKVSKKGKKSKFQEVSISLTSTMSNDNVKSR